MVDENTEATNGEPDSAWFMILIQVVSIVNCDGVRSGCLLLAPVGGGISEYDNTETSIK